jgi:replicative DNA helicase Mcm
MGIFGRLKKPKEHKEIVDSIKNLVDKKRLSVIKKLLSEKKISIKKEKLESSLFENLEFFQIEPHTDEIDATDVNNDLKQKAFADKFNNFKNKSFEEIPKHIAPNITGMNAVKKAVAIQLFANQPIHLLLLGDPGTGKTDILRSAANLSPISSFGLGSGTSGAGLVVTVKGNEVIKGLLPMADKGLCAIDELNLMKKEDFAGMYNAMEKGFVTYDKGGKHYRFDARIKIVATANPKGDKFKGKDVGELRSEIPFDSALLTRFHLVFFIKKPDLEKFKKIAESILSGDKTKAKKGDIEFIKEYVRAIDEKIKKVEFPKEMQKEVISFVEGLKKKEEDHLIEISPRFVIGIMRLCKSLARMEAREAVQEKDIKRVKEIVADSLKIE